MTTRQELTAQIRWTAGHQMSIQDFINTCRNSNDARLNNIAHGIRFGIQTGRLPNWTSDSQGQRFFTLNHQRLNNTQARSAIIAAAIAQTEMTTASATRALQNAFGITTA